MIRRCTVVTLAILLAAGLFGCGSRPGFEGDFARIPPPDAPQDVLTDDELQELRRQEEEERLRQFDELREAHLKKYVEGDVEIDPFATPDVYSISHGDEIGLRFTPQIEMNSVFKVRPDGKIAFDLIGELPVAGLAPAELASTLEELYSVYLRTPSINVVLREFESRRIYVLGEVRKPGMYPLLGPFTLIQAISTAGGWTPDARTQEIMIVRKAADNTPFSFKVNLKEMMAKGEVSGDFHIRNQDIIYVPKGKIASAADFTGRLFDIILPPIDTAWKIFLISDWNSRN